MPMWGWLVVVACLALSPAAAESPRLSKERLVFQTEHGDIHMAFYPDVRAGASYLAGRSGLGSAARPARSLAGRGRVRATHAVAASRRAAA